MAHVLLLNSGGLDSAIMARMLSTQMGHTVHSLHVETDLIAAAQQKAAAQTTANNWCASHLVVPLKWGVTPNFFEYKGLRANMTPEDELAYPTDPPIHRYDDLTDPLAFYQTRPFNEFRTMINTSIIISGIGGAVAHSYDCWDIYSGTRITLGTAFEDTFNSFHDTNRLSVSRPTVHLPLKDYSSYRETLEVGLGLDLDNPTVLANVQTTMGYTHSCRWPTPCGVCEKCTGRADLGM